MTAPRPARAHYAWVILAGVSLALLAASGVRSAFGVFIKPMEAEFGWDRTALSFAAALGFLFNGASGPVVGRLADRWGSRIVLASSGVLYDRFGTYTVAFHSAAFVAFAATLMVLAIRERPAVRRPPAVVMVAPAAGV